MHMIAEFPAAVWEGLGAAYFESAAVVLAILGVFWFFVRRSFTNLSVRRLAAASVLAFGLAPAVVPFHASVITAPVVVVLPFVQGKLFSWAVLSIGFVWLVVFSLWSLLCFGYRRIKYHAV